MLPQGTIGSLNVGDGMKVKVCISFENKVYPMSDISKFVSESNDVHWFVTFIGEEYKKASNIQETRTLQQVFTV